jgi:hypothetical protein
MVENDFKILNETFRERLLFKNIIAYYNCFECLHYLLYFSQVNIRVERGEFWTTHEGDSNHYAKMRHLWFHSWLKTFTTYILTTRWLHNQFRLVIYVI